jgi:hypothetical protein
MPQFVDELKAEADAAIAAMRAAALHARELHARAELMRHMKMTAAKVKDRPRDEAVRAVVDEWLFAWKLDRASFPHVAAMEALTEAFYDYVRDPSQANDSAVRRACAVIEAAFAATDTSLADRMAWRSMCAHGWWGQVKPPPAGAGRPDRDWPDRPFWEHGCLPECL